MWVQKGMGVTIPSAAAAAGTQRLRHATGTKPLLPADPKTVDVLVGEFTALAAVRVLEAGVALCVVMEMVIGVRVAQVHGELVSFCL